MQEDFTGAIGMCQEKLLTIEMPSANHFYVDSLPLI
jgi:hypothetical protein